MRRPPGRPKPVYPLDAVRRECACPVPVVYRDEDGDPVCFRCGQRVKAAKVP